MIWKGRLIACCRMMIREAGNAVHPYGYTGLSPINVVKAVNVVNVVKV